MELARICLRCRATLPKERRKAQICDACKRPSGRPPTVPHPYVKASRVVMGDNASTKLRGWPVGGGWIRLT